MPAGVHIPPWPEPSCEYTSDRGFLTSTAECQHQNWLCNSHCLALSGSTTGAGLELQSTNPWPFGGIMVSNSDEIKTDLWSLQLVGAACLFRPRFFHKCTPPCGSVTKGPVTTSVIVRDILWPVLHSRFLATTFYSAHSSLIGGSILLIEYLMGHIGFQIPRLRHSIFFARPNLPQILGPPAAFPVNFQVARGRRRSEQPAHFGQARPRGPNIQRQIGGWWRIIGISKTPQYIHIYPLVNIQKTMENHHFEWVNQL